MFVGHPNLQANLAKNIGAIKDKVPWEIMKITRRQTDIGNRGGKNCRKLAPLLELAPSCGTVNNDDAQEWKNQGEGQQPTTQPRVGKTTKMQKCRE